LASGVSLPITPTIASIRELACQDFAAIFWGYHDQEMRKSKRTG
jgi:hypothetical protein